MSKEAIKKFAWRMSRLPGGSLDAGSDETASDGFVYLNRVTMRDPVSISRVRGNGINYYGATMSRNELELLVAKLRVHKERCIEQIDSVLDCLATMVAEDIGSEVMACPRCSIALGYRKDGGRQCTQCGYQPDAPSQVSVDS